MIFFVALLESKKWLAVKKAWVENPVVGQESKIFFSEKENAIPDFSKPIGYYLNVQSDGVYDGFICRQFGRFHCFLFYFIYSMLYIYVNLRELNHQLLCFYSN